MMTRFCSSPRSCATAVGVAFSAATLLLTGCSGDPAAGPAAATSLPPAATSETPPAGGTASATATSPTDAPTGPPVTPLPSETGLGPIVAPSEQSTDARSVAPPAEVVTITSIAASSSGATEQLVISTTGGSPGCTLRYVDVVRIDDEPVLTDGDAAMEIVLQAADPNGEQGLAAGVSTELYPEQALLKDVRLAQYLGNTVTFAVGLDHEVPFTLTTTDTAVTITFFG